MSSYIRRTTVNLTKATERQVETLKGRGFGTFTDIVRISIDRMYREEMGGQMKEMCGEERRNEMTYHVQYVQGTQAQTGHLANRIRIMDKPARRYENLSHGWLVSDSDEVSEAEVREIMAELGIPYPPSLPIVYGDYSYSKPEWNSWYYNWDSSLNEDLPVWMQPRWWLLSQDFDEDSAGIGITLAEWRERTRTE